MHDAILVVDQYQRYHEAVQRVHKLDPIREAQGLSILIKLLGRHNRRIAIVSQTDEQGCVAYQSTGFEVIAVNGNRPSELRRFISWIDHSLDRTPPKHLVVVTTDLAFDLLLDRVVRTNETHLAVWAPAATVPVELTLPEYNYRPLEELLPDIKIPRIDIRLDYENLHIGLAKQGWSPDPRVLIEAIKTEVADLGEVVAIIAYADWSTLGRGSGRDFQRELELIGVRTRYQINMNGKNSADMEIENDIRTLVEKDPGAPDNVDAIVLGTCDRDFRPTVETANARGKQLVILSLFLAGSRPAGFYKKEAQC